VAEARHGQAAAAAWRAAPSAVDIREGRADHHASEAAGEGSALTHREEAEAVHRRTADGVRREALRAARAAEAEAEEDSRVSAEAGPCQVHHRATAAGLEERRPTSADQEGAQAARAVGAAQPAAPEAPPDWALGRQNDLGTACGIRSSAAARTASSPH